MKRSRRFWIFVMGAASAILAAVLIWLLWPTPSLSHQAASFTEALLNGDTDYLWDHSVEKFRGDSGLNAESVRKLYNEIFLPQMEGWTVVPGMKIYDKESGPTTGLAQVRIRNKGGRETSLGVSVFNDAEGRGLVRICEVIAKAWRLEYINSGGDTTIEHYLTDAYLAGAIKDADKLRSLGLRGMVPVDPTQPVESFDDMIQRLNEEKALEEEIRRKKASGAQTDQNR